ncbi:hypothetical protein [Chelativorans salis]|uniref:Uncharacterized protein n=1 Tax=Chelativorans salis TaxID=2978478 RepID=A0ABT2LRL8_9HYPH|nr:hypothetical protein [Chelativorans sp. EGI FJ00035]MCT7376273.1 hypothetical protein [Chelativorans sp. EGI FJ00035]
MAPATILVDLRENNLSAEEIQGVTSIPSLRIASLNALSGADRQQLEEILRDTEDGFAEVRTAIEANETLEAQLKDRAVPVSNVVAVTRTETGAITIYTGKPEL